MMELRTRLNVLAAVISFAFLTAVVFGMFSSWMQARADRGKQGSAQSKLQRRGITPAPLCFRMLQPKVGPLSA